MIEGDARDEGALIRALDGCDAVVSSLGTGVGCREVSLLTVATRALVTAMTRSGVRVWSALAVATWGAAERGRAGGARQQIRRNAFAVNCVECTTRSTAGSS